MTMITKQIAGLLYSFSYNLQDNEGNVWRILHPEAFGLICNTDKDIERYIAWKEIGSTYKILAREMDLTKPIEGVGIPIVELAKITFPLADWKISYRSALYGTSCFEYKKEETGFYFYEDGVDMFVPNQLSLFNWLYTHHFNLDFPEGTTTNLI